LGESAAEQPVVGAGQEQCVVQAGVGDLVAVAGRDPGDQPVGAQPAQILAHPSGGQLVGVAAEQLGNQRAQVAVGEPVRQQPEDQQRAEQGVRAGVGEPQSGDPMSVRGEDRVVDRGEDLGAAGGVVAESLDAEQAPVGGEADLAQRGQIGQPFADSEVGGVVDRGLGAQRPSFLVVLLDRGVRCSPRAGSG
jgi:hypothetical protein